MASMTDWFLGSRAQSSYILSHFLFEFDFGIIIIIIIYLFDLDFCVWFVLFFFLFDVGMGDDDSLVESTSRGAFRRVSDDDWPDD
jgi:hypothetical protein